MAKVFDQQISTRLTPVWRAASKHLLVAPNHSDYNLVLEISDPISSTAEDIALMTAVNGAMQANTKDRLTLNTVAETIFPQSMYRRFGRPEMYGKILNALDRGGKPGTWGTYAERMISRKSSNGILNINPLELMIEKLKTNAISRRTYQSSYELNIADPEVDLAITEEADFDGGDIPTYNPALDARRNYGGPCLSNVSFKIVGKDTLTLTAIYRSHHYCARALGNLLGLARLLNFASTETGLRVGTLTCISTFASLDTASWGGVSRVKAILD
jgi:hypothetical protein